MKATRIIAKRKSICPGCYQNIFPGVPCQVYDNKWYHVECWQEMWDKIAEEKDENKIRKEYVKDIDEQAYGQGRHSSKDEYNDKYLDMEVKQEENANELRTIVLQIEVLTGRVREIAKEMGSW